jgi:hypothetical protein
MNKTAAEYPAEVNEFEVAGLTPAPSDKGRAGDEAIVRPPRVAESPVLPRKDGVPAEPGGAHREGQPPAWAGDRSAAGGC